MSKALILLSGGQDSTTCLFWAKKHFKEIEAIGFDYGQKHKKELEQAQKICDIENVDYKVLNIEGLLGGSSLTDLTQSTSEQHKIDNSLPSTFTAGRNALFLTVITSYGYNKNIHDIVTGTCQTDYSGYFDCRRVFIDSIQTSLTLALGKDIRIHTPLMYLTKSETWKLAKELDCLDIVKNLTLTDYNGNMGKKNDWGYGDLDNPASILRAKGYQEALANGWI